MDGVDVMALPDYLILGAQRAGTTSLYNWLIAHPKVVPAANKEVRYFTFHEKRGLHWYGRQLGVRTKHSLHGEAEPNYLFCTHIIPKVRALVPNVKMIVLLRDPVARAFSNWKLMRELGYEKLGFTEALRGEEKRVKGNEHDWLYHSYKGRGRYAEQLEAWLDAFPLDQFMIIRSEKMFAEPMETYREVLKFLILPDRKPKRFKVWNKKGQRGLHHKTRDYLRDYFRPYNERLAALLGMEEMGWE